MKFLSQLYPFLQKYFVMHSHLTLGYPVVDPAFSAIMRFPLKRRDSFFYFKIKKKPFLENGLESPLIFVFILKGKNKIRNKNPKCDS